MRWWIQQGEALPPIVLVVVVVPSRGEGPLRLRGGGGQAVWVPEKGTQPEDGVVVGSMVILLPKPLRVIDKGCSLIPLAVMIMGGRKEGW